MAELWQIVLRSSFSGFNKELQSLNQGQQQQKMASMLNMKNSSVAQAKDYQASESLEKLGEFFEHIGSSMYRHLD